MVGDNLKILITGTLNHNTSLSEINTALGKLEKDTNLKKLNVKIGINDTQISEIAKQISQIQDKLKSFKPTSMVSPQDETKIKNVYKSIEDAVKEYQKLGAVKISRDSIDPVTKQVKEFTLTIQKSEAEIDKLKFKLASLTDVQGLPSGSFVPIKGSSVDKSLVIEAKQTQQVAAEKAKLRQELVKLGQTGNVTSQQLANIAKAVNTAGDLAGINQAKQAYKQLADQAKIAEQMAKEREKASLATAQTEAKANEAQQKAINKNNELVRKEIEQQQKLEAEIKRRLELYEREKQLQAENLKSRYGKTMSQDNLNSLNSQLSTVSGAASNPSQFKSLQELTNFQQRANLGFKELSNNLQNATQHSLTFGSALQQAFEKFPVWMITATAFYAPIRALQDMTDRLIQIDTQMTEIRRVMDVPDFRFTEMLQEAVGASDQLSSKLTDVLSIMADFGRMGFNDDQLLDITKTAQVFQNISDLDATASVDTLTSAMLNFNIASEDSLTIADKLNEVNISSLPLQ